MLNGTIASLEQRMRASSLVVATCEPADVRQLYSVEGVQSIEETGHNRYRIFHDKDKDPAVRIAEIVVGAGWGLAELVPERRSMEQIFIDITQTSPQGEEQTA